MWNLNTINTNNHAMENTIIMQWNNIECKCMLKEIIIFYDYFL